MKRTIIAANWAKIGVTVQIVSMNATAESAARDNLTYTGLINFGLSIARPDDAGLVLSKQQHERHLRQG